MPPVGVGGTRGTLSGGMVESEVGVAGEPGGGGWACVAVLLEVPGRTTVSESLILAFVFESGFFKSAKFLYEIVSDCHSKLERPSRT